MDYISIKQLSEKWGISTRQVQILCRDGRVLSAIRIAKTWAVSVDAAKPKDERIKSRQTICKDFEGLFQWLRKKSK